MALGHRCRSAWETIRLSNSICIVFRRLEGLAMTDQSARFVPAGTRRLQVTRNGRSILRSAGVPKPVVLVDTREKQPLPLFANHPNWIAIRPSKTSRVASSHSIFRRACIPMPSSAPWMPSKQSSESRSSILRPCAGWPLSVPQVGSQSTSPTGGWKRTDMAEC